MPPLPRHEISCETLPIHATLSSVSTNLQSRASASGTQTASLASMSSGFTTGFRFRYTSAQTSTSPIYSNMNTFMSVLTAPYSPPSRVLTALGWDTYCAAAAAINEHSSQSTRKASAIDRDDIASPTKEQATPIYTPHGPWAWSAGLPIRDTVQLIQLCNGAQSNISVKQSQIGSKTFVHISKTSFVGMGNHLSTMSEISLYGSKGRLRDLQGDVVPSLVKAIRRPAGKLEMIMEPPHPCFWIEASADMPDVLKQRCVAAFERLHSVGVLHGAPELRHMLIGADTKVTLVDFKHARVLDSSTPHQFAMEMRLVKFKLNYEGARQAEQEQNDYCGSRSDAPIDTAEEQWSSSAETVPRRFIMPGQTEKDVKLAIARFTQFIHDLENSNNSGPRVSSRRISFDSAQSQMRLPSFIFRVPSSERFQNSVTSEQPVAGPSRLKSGATTATLTDKRRSSYPIPEKRKSSSDVLEIDQPSTKKVRWQSLAPSSSCSSVDTSPVQPRRLAAQSLPGIKVRDFAYEPYDGPKGYYVPEPFREAVMATERRRHIHMLNGRAMDEVLRQATPIQRTEYSRMKLAAQGSQQKMIGLRSLGRLKRVLDELADPVPNGSAIKRQKYNHGLGRSSKEKRRAVDGAHPTTSPSAGDENCRSAPSSSMTPARRNSIASTQQPKPILRKSTQGLNGEAPRGANVYINLVDEDDVSVSSNSRAHTSTRSTGILGSRYTSRRNANGSRIAPTYTFHSLIPIQPVCPINAGPLESLDDDDDVVEQGVNAANNITRPMAARKPYANDVLAPLPESEMKTMEEDPYSLAAQMAWATLGLRPFPPRDHLSREQQRRLSLPAGRSGEGVVTLPGANDSHKSQRQFQPNRLSFSARLPHISPDGVVPVGEPEAGDDDDSAEEEEVALMLMMSTSPTIYENEVSLDVCNSSASTASWWRRWWQFFR